MSHQLLNSMLIYKPYKPIYLTLNYSFTIIIKNYSVQSVNYNALKDVQRGIISVNTALHDLKLKPQQLDDVWKTLVVQLFESILIKQEFVQQRQLVTSCLNFFVLRESYKQKACTCHCLVRIKDQLIVYMFELTGTTKDINFSKTIKNSLVDATGMQ